ncbi:MAG: helix-turn-helix domain-containing protein [Dehalococcoidales bacterium]|nr:helix-turn-helix domain-containing protein [Dehalococcoidales bacterium]
MESGKFGKRIKELRLKAGLSQRVVADAAGISFTYLSKIENGVMPPPGEEVIVKLAEVLSGDKDELLTLAGKVPSDIVSQILNNPDILKSIRKGRINKNAESSFYIYGEFGKKLRELREKAGLSQSELAEKTGVSFTYLSKIENGVKPAPSQKVIIKLAEVLEADTDTLLTAAGKVPVDIVSRLNNKETLRALRENKNRNVWNTTRRTRMMGIVKSLFSYNKLSKVAIPLILVAAVAGSLWFATPNMTKALQMEITSRDTGYVNVPYTFSVTVTIDEGEYLPITSAGLKIYSVDNPQQYMEVFSDLPVAMNDSKDYGSAQVTVYAPDLNTSYHTGNVTWNGQAYSFVSPGDYYTPCTITYNVVWTPPQNWPAGAVKIEAAILSAEGKSFVVEKGFTISAAEMLAETSMKQFMNAQNIPVIQISVDALKYANGDPYTLEGGLGSVEGKYTMLNDNMQVLKVLPAPGFTNVVYDLQAGTFSADAISPDQPANTPVAQLVVKLTGNATDKNNLSVEFTAIENPAGTVNVPAEAPLSMALLRGDLYDDPTHPDEVNLDDSYVAAMIYLTKFDPNLYLVVNGASPYHEEGKEIGVDLDDSYVLAMRYLTKFDIYFQYIP